VFPFCTCFYFVRVSILYMFPFCICFYFVHVSILYLFLFCTCFHFSNISFSYTTCLYTHPHVLHRGSELINSRLIQRIECEKERESVILAKLRNKLEKIRLRQGRINPKDSSQSNDHYLGQLCHTTHVKVV